MSIKMISPVGKKVMNIRKVDVQLYLKRGYKYVDASTDLETVEMMSPAGQVVVMKSDVGDYLQREGWSLLEPKPSAKDEIPEPPTGDETPEPPVEDEIPDAAPVEEPELAVEQEPEPEAETESEPEPVKPEEAEETIE